MYSITALAESNWRPISIPDEEAEETVSQVTMLTLVAPVAACTVHKKRDFLNGTSAHNRPFSAMNFKLDNTKIK